MSNTDKRFYRYSRKIQINVFIGNVGKTKIKACMGNSGKIQRKSLCRDRDFRFSDILGLVWLKIKVMQDMTIYSHSSKFKNMLWYSNKIKLFNNIDTTTRPETHGPPNQLQPELQTNKTEPVFKQNCKYLKLIKCFLEQKLLS